MVDLPHPLTRQPFPSPVPPGTGWPDDPASADTAAADDADAVHTLADTDDLAVLDARVSVCRACPRLVTWREDVAQRRQRPRAAFADQPYWGRPIAGWGDDAPRVLVVGLAPAAHGGNRTGRVFTGDSSGDWLFASLHRVGLAAQPTSTHAGDGQRLLGARMVATVRCAPPDNRPSVVERDACAPWIQREVALIAPGLRVVVALGGYGWDGALRSFAAAGYVVPRPKPRFGHGAETSLSHPDLSHPDLSHPDLTHPDLTHPDRAPLTLLGCYHPSQQNTFTGRLTADMLDDVLGRAARLAAGSPD